MKRAASGDGRREGLSLAFYDLDGTITRSCFREEF
jgi:hypothetical protein